MDFLRDAWDAVSSVIPGNVVGAILLLIIGWIVARLLAGVVEAALRRSGIERRVSPYMDGGGPEEGGAASMVGQVVFYIIMLFVIIAVLDVLQLQVATEPMSDLLSGIFGFIPNIIGAVVLAILAYILAKIARAVVVRLAQSAQLDQRLQSMEGREATQDAGDGGDAPLARGLGEAAFLIVLLLFLPLILGALEMGGLLEPVVGMLNTVIGFLPNLIAAGLILAIGWFLARIIGRIVTNFLAGAGFDELPARAGLTSDGSSEIVGGWRPSGIVGTALTVVIIWFTVIQALAVLEFAALTALAVSLLELAGRILLGLVIIGIGVWFAQFAAGAVRRNVRQQPNLLAFVAQAAIVLLFGAMGLQQMGVADSIINLAFGILFGAIGIAVAIAFGIGGREPAGRLVERWLNRAETGRLDDAAGDTQPGGPSD